MNLGTAETKAASQGVRSVREQIEVNLGTERSGVTETPQRASLEAGVRAALEQGVSFNFNGKLYVPVDPKTIRQ